MTKHQLQRLRHETRRRTLTVTALSYLTPRMLRISFTSPDLTDFVSPGADDHIKLFFPTPAGVLAMRDFTPRAYDNARQMLVIDFALHEAGPATEWASQAAVGDQLQIGGPRGSTVVPDDYDWRLFIGDETAFPAIARQLENLAPGRPAAAFMIVEAEDEVMHFDTPAALTQIWIVRDGRGDDAAQLRAALDSYAPPPGDGFVWIAAEAEVARSLRLYMAEERGHPRVWMKAAGYWAKGMAAGGGRIEDDAPADDAPKPAHAPRP